MARPSKITREHVEAVCKHMAEAACPFVSVAAERSGLTRGLVKDWILQAEKGLTVNPLMHELATRCRTIRADWMDRTMARLQKEPESESKHAGQAFRNMIWLLERLDRDLFDISSRYLPKNLPKIEPTPEPPAADTLDQALSELERGDLHEVH